MHADLLLIDEAAGRAEARRRNLRVTGTLGILRAAAERELVDVPGLIARIEATSFYADGHARETGNVFRSAAVALFSRL
jgi:predicted nucleic acid-binding protein